MKALQQLLIDELKLRYHSEEQQVAGLPRIAEIATCLHLQKLIQSHQGETEGHIQKLAHVFRAFQTEISVRPCEVTAALLRECDHMTAAFQQSPAINAALIAVAQKIEHCEIASYGCLREWAVLLENKEASGLLEELLDQEKAANQSLIKLARFRCNKEALSDTDAADLYCDRYGHETAKSKELNLARKDAKPFAVPFPLQPVA